MEADETRSPLVLVVDDNRDLADNVAELLSEGGIKSLAVYSASEARAAMSGRACDLAILDIRMPEVSGVDLMVDIKGTCPNAEVILMTANASLDTAIQAVHEGAFAYLEKPFDSQQLLTLSERALTQARLRRDAVRLQNHLTRSEALYRKVVDSVEALILGIDADGRMRMVNRLAIATLGFSREQLLGMPLQGLASTGAAADTLAASLAEARRGQQRKQVELTLTTAEGSERITRWSFLRMDPTGDDEELVLAVGTDLTDQLDLERRAAEAEAMAAIATLTAGLAHEIRNPLNAASLQLQLLRRQTAKLDAPDLQEKLDRRITIVDGELSRLSNLLDDFLNLARPQRLSLSPLPLTELLQSVFLLQEPAARKAGVKLVVEPPDPALRAMGDRPMLTQVMVNLVLNATDALRGRGGEIHLRGFALGESRVGLEVTDDGPGIPQDIARQLFTPFVTSKEAGTGLGLTIVKRIVDRHGGTVQVSSPAGGGTTVRISLDRG